VLCCLLINGILVGALGLVIELLCIRLIRRTAILTWKLLIVFVIIKILGGPSGMLLLCILLLIKLMVTLGSLLSTSL
jgi:hypothetical protein